MSLFHEVEFNVQINIIIVKHDRNKLHWTELKIQVQQLPSLIQFERL